VAGSFLAQIERARAAAQTTRPAEKPVAEMNGAEMNGAEMDAALRQARVEAIEANRAVAEAAAEHTRPPTLAAVLADLKRSKRRGRR
jgi:hypothetical protein